VKLRIAGAEWRRHALAAAGGLLLACAFPNVNMAGLAWVAPGAILLAGLGGKPGTTFRAGYVAGLAFYLTSLYWLLLIPVRFAPIVGWLALGLFLSLYPATWSWLVWRAFPAGFDPAEPGFDGLLRRFVSTTWAQRFRWCLLAAAAWVAWEMAQARFLSGFPWNFLGASQARMVPLIQISSVTGIYGVSFLVAWFSSALLCAFVRLAKEPNKRAWSLEAWVPAIAILAALGWGVQRLKSLGLPNEHAIKIALTQPSIPQTNIWDQSYTEKAARFASLLALSEAALTNKPALLVWPEAALPDLLRWATNEYNGKTILDAITDLARRHHVWMVVGADDAELKPGTPDGVVYYNSSFLINPDGDLVADYRKRRLVIFGEYVPLSRWLPFLKKFAQVQGEFTPGQRVAAFNLRELDVQTSVLICFEDTFPHHTRAYVDPETDFLLNLTNNGWFGESAAQWQHALNAVFRAVENGVPLVRCANNGLTCWVDRAGAMHEIYFSGSTDIYKEGYKIAQVPLPAHGRWPPTFYREHGDYFGRICVAITLVTLAASLVSRPARS
jgi:apolipoprotein N-acyltransferase